MIKKVIFSDYEKVFSAISEILENAGIEEPPIEDETLKGEFLISTLTKATKSLVAKEISERDLSSSLAKDLSISDKISEKVIKDIKEKLVPLTETVEIAENYTPPTEDFVQKAIREAETEILETRNEITERTEPTKNIKKLSPITNKKTSESLPPNKDLDINKNIPQKPDQYREPL